MINVLQQVQETIRCHDLLDPGDRVVVGLSGGPDSLCLLHVLRRLFATYRLQLHVAHLNHGTRGEASDADAEFARRTAIAWELPVTVKKRDVPRLAADHGLAFEEAARRVRYAFLAQVAESTGAGKVAVGHNADDQAETVLMHFLRGSGLAGLRGMLPRTPINDYRLLEPFTDQEVEREKREAPRGARPEPGRGKHRRTSDKKHKAWASTCIIRPLLEVPRADIERYCAEHALSPRFDRSNLDTTYFRNRLRHELLPELETYNPNIRERLRHTAAVVAADYDLLVRVRRQAWESIVREEREDAIVFDQTAWQALPVSLQRATLRYATYQLRRSLRDVTFVHVENAREVALEGETGKQATLPMGLTLTVGYETLTVGEAGEAGPPPEEPLLWGNRPLSVPLPGTTPLPESDWILEARVLKQWDLEEITATDHPWTTYLDAEALAQPVLLRSRRRGDRFRPRGMEGHSVKVSELMINLKIPQAWRDHVPLLVAAGEILWVCGRRIAEGATVEPDTRQVARFRFERAT
ncbi:MAG: tRNA lysidine(34) synthetase TilS [Anaerolineae bacterium]|jgi:tRNA(Ile)-lysidine synthase